VPSYHGEKLIKSPTPASFDGYNKTNAPQFAAPVDIGIDDPGVPGYNH
jgi:hypothetical protein